MASPGFLQTAGLVANADAGRLLIVMNAFEARLVAASVMMLAYIVFEIATKSFLSCLGSGGS
jgi:hypothetical protein